MTDGIPLRFLGDLARIEYKEGDVFVLFSSAGHFLRKEEIENIKKHWDIVMPGSRVIVLQNVERLGILAKEDAMDLRTLSEKKDG